MTECSGVLARYFRYYRFGFCMSICEQLY